VKDCQIPDSDNSEKFSVRAEELPPDSALLTVVLTVLSERKVQAHTTHAAYQQLRLTCVLLSARTCTYVSGIELPGHMHALLQQVLKLYFIFAIRQGRHAGATQIGAGAVYWRSLSLRSQLGL
jgi:hypothetical protein